LLPAALALAAATASVAQQAPRTPGAQSLNARQQAPNDLTGYWVSVITEDWRWRMMTAPKGDYASVPLNDAGRNAADAWDREADVRNGNECRPYGAGGIMRAPGRLHVTWADDATLKIETDAGTQTRLFHFGAFDRAAPNWQGNSAASWQMVGAVRGSPPTGGSLKVVTTGAKSGYLRWNGVPYSDDAVITEHLDRYVAFGDEWLTVTTIVEDPKYLSQPFIVSTDFKREPNASKWHPTPCVTDAPARERAPPAGG
jgi:hypothetical protein